MNWQERLKESHEWADNELSPLEFLVDYIFDIATYDGSQSKKIGTKMIEVIDAINNKTTFDYIKDEDNYTWYLMVCNLPFVANRIEWGCSIRGAWWEGDVTLRTCGLVDEDGDQQTDWRFSGDDWEEFMKACVKYSKVLEGVK